jgi:hypothetical protein
MGAEQHPEAENPKIVGWHLLAAASRYDPDASVAGDLWSLAR